VRRFFAAPGSPPALAQDRGHARVFIVEGGQEAHSAARADRRRLGLQLLLLYAALEGALWSSGTLRVVFALSAAGLAVLAVLWERRFWPVLGLAPGSIRRGLWFAPVGAGVAGLILLGAWGAHTLHVSPDSGPVWLRVGEYLLWALVQQFILQSCLFLRLEVLLGQGFGAVAVSALLFCIAHVPNPVLMPVTLVGGLLLCELFRRYRTVYVLALAHALVALSLAISVPQSLLHHMRVGIAYFMS
jgi:hypothetical protein